MIEMTPVKQNEIDMMAHSAAVHLACAQGML
jgi:hypothetical protein